MNKKFIIKNIDPAYSELKVYYTRTTSEVNQSHIIEAKRIINTFPISSNKSNTIIITGFEETEGVALEEINLKYSVYTSAQSHVICQNRLFLANVTEEETYAKELE